MSNPAEFVFWRLMVTSEAEHPVLTHPSAPPVVRSRPSSAGARDIRIRARADRDQNVLRSMHARKCERFPRCTCETGLHTMQWHPFGRVFCSKPDTVWWAPRRVGVPQTRRRRTWLGLSCVKPRARKLGKRKRGGVGTHRKCRSTPRMRARLWLSRQASLVPKTHQPLATCSGCVLGCRCLESSASWCWCHRRWPCVGATRARKQSGACLPHRGGSCRNPCSTQLTLAEGAAGCGLARLGGRLRCVLGELAGLPLPQAEGRAPKRWDDSRNDVCSWRGTLHTTLRYRVSAPSAHRSSGCWEARRPPGD